MKKLIQEAALEAANNVCGASGDGCATFLSEATVEWLADVVADQAVGNQRARESFTLLFSNPGAIATDTERLAMFGAALDDPDFIGELRSKIDQKLASPGDFDGMDLDASTLRQFSFEIATGLVVNLTIEALARHYERTGQTDAAYWTRTAMAETFDIATLGLGLAKGTLTATGAVPLAPRSSFPYTAAELA